MPSAPAPLAAPAVPPVHRSPIDTSYLSRDGLPIGVEAADSGDSALLIEHPAPCLRLRPVHQNEAHHRTDKR